MFIEQKMLKLHISEYTLTKTQFGNVIVNCWVRGVGFLLKTLF